jgi:hypothetical protein
MSLRGATCWIEVSVNHKSRCISHPGMLKCQTQPRKRKTIGLVKRIPHHDRDGWKCIRKALLLDYFTMLKLSVCLSSLALKIVKHLASALPL